MREAELGLVTDGFFEDYAAVVQVLEEPASLTERVECGGGRSLEIQLLPNWNGHLRTWRYPDQRDIRLVLRVTTDGETLGFDPLLRRLSVVGEWRVLTEH